MKNVDREDEEVTYKTSKGEGKSTVSEILSQLIFVLEAKTQKRPMLHCHRPVD